jgi:hypothetical protein
MQCLGIVDCTLVRTVDKDKKWLHRQGFARAFEVFGCPDASIEEVAHHGSTDPLIITAVLLARGIPMDTIKAQLPQALTREPHTIENQSETEACSSKCGDTFRQAIQLMINYISEPERAKSGGDGLECCPGVQCPSAISASETYGDATPCSAPTVSATLLCRRCRCAPRGTSAGAAFQQALRLAWLAAPAGSSQGTQSTHLGWNGATGGYSATNNVFKATYKYLSNNGAGPAACCRIGLVGCTLNMTYAALLDRA